MQIIDKEEPEFLLDRRQDRCWKYYFDPKSTTYGNANKSAIKAGYPETTAHVITCQDWFKTKIRRMNFLNKAESVQQKILTMDTTDSEGDEQADLLRVQADVAKHVMKTLGKNDGYTERTEMTGKDGNPIIFMPQELMTKFNLEQGDGELVDEEVLLEDNKE